MFHQKMLEFLLLVKIKVPNFIRESLNLPPPHSADAYDASALDQLHYFYLCGFTNWNVLVIQLLCRVKCFANCNCEKLGLFTSNVRHWEGGGSTCSIVIECDRIANLIACE